MHLAFRRSALISATRGYIMSETPFHSEPGGQPDAIVEDRLAEPRLFQVLLHNDDYTTMEFVVDILMRVFHKNADQATAIMLAVHKNGVGVAGVYPYELAETKVERTRHLAREANFPLRCTIQEVGA